MMWASTPVEQALLPFLWPSPRIHRGIWQEEFASSLWPYQKSGQFHMLCLRRQNQGTSCYTYIFRYRKLPEKSAELFMSHRLVMCQNVRRCQTWRYSQVVKEVAIILVFLWCRYGELIEVRLHILPSDLMAYRTPSSHLHFKMEVKLASCTLVNHGQGTHFRYGHIDRPHRTRPVCLCRCWSRCSLTISRRESAEAVSACLRFPVVEAAWVSLSRRDHYKVLASRHLVPVMPPQYRRTISSSDGKPLPKYHANSCIGGWFLCKWAPRSHICHLEICPWCVARRVVGQRPGSPVYRPSY